MFSILSSYYITLVIIDFSTTPSMSLNMCYYRFGKDRKSSVTNIEYKHFMLPGFTDTCLFEQTNKQTKTSKEILACFATACVNENLFSNQCQHDNMLLPWLTEKPVLSNIIDFENGSKLDLSTILFYLSKIVPLTFCLKHDGSFHSILQLLEPLRFLHFSIDESTF